jgi:hypothetical protein
MLTLIQIAAIVVGVTIATALIHHQYPWMIAIGIVMTFAVLLRYFSELRKYHQGQ